VCRNAPETATYFSISLDDNYRLAMWKCLRYFSDRLDDAVDNHHLSPCERYNDLADDLVPAPGSRSCHLDKHI